jgi:hypothetical protein
MHSGGDANYQRLRLGRLLAQGRLLEPSFARETYGRAKLSIALVFELKICEMN